MSDADYPDPEAARRAWDRWDWLCMGPVPNSGTLGVGRPRLTVKLIYPTEEL
jgi:hypothetical protein